MSPNSAFATLLLLAAAAPVAADPGYYVLTAYADEGVSTAEFRYWTVKFPRRPTVIWPEVGFGHGVTSRWHTRLLASYIGSSQMATRVSTVNWQNDVLLTQGEYPFDLALHASLIANRDRNDADALEFGPVFQTDVGRTALNANLLFERPYRSPAAAPTGLKYQWQLRHRWSPGWQFGAQGFGELGPWDHWLPRDAQSHRVGPALFGQSRLRDRQALHYQAAYLYGSVYGRRAEMFSLRVAHSF